MATLSQALRKLIDNPDDLTELPGLIEKVSNLENDVEGYQERIVKMQDLNKKYLAMVPITDDDPAQAETKEEEPATLEDAKDYLVQSIGGEQ